MPTCTSNWNWRAAPPSRVKMARAVAVRVVVDEAQRFVVGVDPHDARAPGRRSRRRRPACPGRTSSSSDAPRKKPVAVELRARGRRPRPSRPRRPRRRGSTATLSRCSRRDERAHLASRARCPGPMRSFGSRSAIASTSGSRDVADGDDDRDGHAPLAGRAVAGRHRGVGGHVDVGVGQHDHVVLGPAEGLHPLAVRGAGLVDVPGDRRRADEAHRGDVGVLEDAVDGHLVALHDVEHAVGQPGLPRAARRGAATPTGPSRSASARTCCRRRWRWRTSTSAPWPGS